MPKCYVRMKFPFALFGWIRPRVGTGKDRQEIQKDDRFYVR
jgi:hypothetical protein